MLERVLTHIHNWFEVSWIADEWQVVDGCLDLPFIQDEQYYRIYGSVFNDGLHKYPDNDLTDEKFSGVICGLAIPKQVIEIAEDIAEWQEKNGDQADSPFQSESFGGYSYSKGSEASNDNGLSGWQKAFASKLNPWRKLAEYVTF